MIIDDTVYIDIADILNLVEKLLKRGKHPLRKLRITGVPHDSAHFTRIWPDVAGTETLVLEILFPPVGEPGGTEPRPDGELDSIDTLLQ